MAIMSIDRKQEEHKLLSFFFTANLQGEKQRSLDLRRFFEAISNSLCLEMSLN